MIVSAAEQSLFDNFATFERNLNWAVLRCEVIDIDFLKMDEQRQVARAHIPALFSPFSRLTSQARRVNSDAGKECSRPVTLHINNRSFDATTRPTTGSHRLPLCRRREKLISEVKMQDRRRIGCG
jgi:hypothetical protein